MYYFSMYVLCSLSRQCFSIVRQKKKLLIGNTESCRSACARAMDWVSYLRRTLNGLRTLADTQTKQAQKITRQSVGRTKSPEGVTSNGVSFCGERKDEKRYKLSAVN